MSVLFHKHVPLSGKADCKAGEIVRAFTRIEYRNWNDGDHIGVGYGKETCNPAARFLVQETNDEIADIISVMYGMYSDSKYDAKVEELKAAVLCFLDSNPELFNIEARDMWEYRDPIEDVDDEDYEDDCYW